MDVLTFSQCDLKNKNLVGGKNSSLGELYHLSSELNFSIADGFAITTHLYDNFLLNNKIHFFVEHKLQEMNLNSSVSEIEECSALIQSKILESNFSDTQIQNIETGYNNLSLKYKVRDLEVAVRSSAIAEDLPNASFAGQQDTYLNVSGISSLLESIKNCFASLFNTRAISYRLSQNIAYDDIKISVGIQKMVRSDIGSAGVGFSMDPETGYNKAIVINSSFGLGEIVVSGGVLPDEIICDKKTLLNNNLDPIISKKKGNKILKIIYSSSGNGIEEIKTSNDEFNQFSISEENSVRLASIILNLENKYQKLHSNPNLGVDVEWAIDGNDKQIYILQTRPETIHSNLSSSTDISKFILERKGKKLIEGVAVGDKISNGKVRKLTSLKEAYLFKKGEILVTDMTTPDWEPIMKLSSGIVTNRGGRTCHAAIVAREMGLNAVVGTQNCTQLLKDGQEVTLDCSKGERADVLEGILPFRIDKIKLKKVDQKIKLMLNVGNPEAAFSSSMLPNQGVGLARLEFIINHYIKVHPTLLLHYLDSSIPTEMREKVEAIISPYKSGEEYFVKNLARAMAQISSAFYPHNVIVRFSDFKSNEYKSLLGGELYEPNEENPMIGWRGASRYYSEEYTKSFELECKAIKYVREKMGLTNLVVMIPFCRTPQECQLVLDTMEKYQLKRGENGLEVYIMCELPSNVMEAEEFSLLVDGVSIGGNDLLQLTVGLDRDNEKLTQLTDHTNLSYRRMISQAISIYKKNGVKVGFCGQQPSDSVEFCQFLINEGTDSISVTPDSVLHTLNNI